VIEINEGGLKVRVGRDPGAAPTPEQSRRAKRMSEILSQATKVLGSAAAVDA
jgi:hypothetical protein